MMKLWPRLRCIMQPDNATDSQSLQKCEGRRRKGKSSCSVESISPLTPAAFHPCPSGFPQVMDSHFPTAILWCLFFFFFFKEDATNSIYSSVFFFTGPITLIIILEAKAPCVSVCGCLRSQMHDPTCCSKSSMNTAALVLSYPDCPLHPLHPPPTHSNNYNPVNL